MVHTLFLALGREEKGREFKVIFRYIADLKPALAILDPVSGKQQRVNSLPPKPSDPHKYQQRTDSTNVSTNLCPHVAQTCPHSSVHSFLLLSIFLLFSLLFSNHPLLLCLYSVLSWPSLAPFSVALSTGLILQRLCLLPWLALAWVLCPHHISSVSSLPLCPLLELFSSPG